MPLSARPNSTLLQAMPPELICNIMLHTLPPVPSSDGMRVPLTWGQVCQEWRYCALSNPALWSTIYHCKPAFCPPMARANSTTELDFLLLNSLFEVMERWKSVLIDAKDCECMTIVPESFCPKCGDEDADLSGEEGVVEQALGLVYQPFTIPRRTGEQPRAR